MNKDRIARAIKSMMSASVVLIVIGLVFKLQHWPNGSLIFIIGSSGFLIFSGLNMAIRCAKPAQENPATRVINIVYLLSASAVLLGSLFKLQHYPYGAALLLIGIVGGAIAGMADYGWSRKIGNKSEEQNRP